MEEDKVHNTDRNKNKSVVNRIISIRFLVNQDGYLSICNNKINGGREVDAFLGFVIPF